MTYWHSSDIKPEGRRPQSRHYAPTRQWVKVVRRKVAVSVHMILIKHMDLHQASLSCDQSVSFTLVTVTAGFLPGGEWGVASVVVKSHKI